nr:hypothetical protein [Hydrogenophaga sp. A37]
MGDGGRQVVVHLLQQQTNVRRFESHGVALQAHEMQQVVQQGLHAFPTGVHALQIALRDGRKLRVVVGHQQAAEIADGVDRFAQVVGNDVDEPLLFQRLVLQQRDAGLQLFFPEFERVDVVHTNDHANDVASVVAGGQVGHLDMAGALGREAKGRVAGHRLPGERLIEFGADHGLEQLFAHEAGHHPADHAFLDAAPVVEVGRVDKAVHVAGVHERHQVSSGQARGGQVLQPVVGLGGFAARMCLVLTVALQQVEHQAGEGLQGAPLVVIELPGFAVGHADRAQGMALGGGDGRARIEADVGVVKHQGVVFETPIQRCVRHLHHLVRVEDGVGAEGHVPAGLPGVHADHRLEPLTFLIDEGNQRDGGVTDRCGQRRDVLKRLLGQGVEHAEIVQLRQALGFSGRDGGDHHVRRGRWGSELCLSHKTDALDATRLQISARKFATFAGRA